MFYYFMPTFHTRVLILVSIYLNTCDQSTSTIPNETLCNLIRMILTLNCFEFNNPFYIQTHGTAMGTCMAPSYANLFLAKFETDALKHAQRRQFLLCAKILKFFKRGNCLCQ